MTDANDEHDGTLHGAEANLSTSDDPLAALRQAMDYRGDVTLELEGGESIEGYVFDLRPDATPATARVIPSDGSARRTIEIDRIERLVFSGRDTADGRSWETWVRKYQEKKARGESASIEPEPLDES